MANKTQIYSGPDYPSALTIAGSDSSGGAGIQADLKTFTALGVYGMSAITAVTAQNTVGVNHVQVLSADSVKAQIDAVMSDIGCVAAKTGMLATSEIVTVVADAVRRWNIPNLVIDPVMISKSGHHLLQPEAVAVLRDELLPLATVVTPNIPEAEELSGRKIHDRQDIFPAAREICRTGCAAVIIKGGHLSGDADDYLYIADEDRYHSISGQRIESKNTHGTGCTFSAALCAGLAGGMSLPDASRLAKKFVTAAITSALDIGSGHGPTNHIAAGNALRDGDGAILCPWA